MATQCITFWVVTKFITFSMATKFVPFRWRQCLSASELSFSLLCSWEFPDILKKSTKYPETLRSKDAEMRGHGCLKISLKRHKQRNETNTFELMAFFWHGNSASVRVQNRPKAFKALEKPSKHLERGPRCGAFRTLQKPSKHFERHPNWTWRSCAILGPLPSNRADFLKTLQISLYFLKKS